MKKQEFSKYLAQIILSNGFDSPIVSVFKQALTGKSDSQSFYNNVTKQDYLDTYVKLVNSGNVNVRDQEDTEPLNSESFWNRDKSSFIYTAKILPEIRNQYPDTYNKVFDGKQVLPAGLGGRPKNGNTIWNAVEQAEGEEEPVKTGKTAYKSAENKSNKVDKDKVEKAVKKFVNDNKGKEFNIKPEQIPKVSQFVTKLLQSM